MGFPSSIILSIIQAAIPIALIIAVIAAITAIVRRSKKSSRNVDVGIGTVRRIFNYALLFLSLMATLAGLNTIVTTILDLQFATTIVSDISQRMSIGIALTIVGTPGWILFWVVTKRSVAFHPIETETLGRKLYLYGSLAISAAVVTGASVGLVKSLLSLSDFNSLTLSLFITWLATWILHWRVASAENSNQHTNHVVGRLYVYTASAYGLGLLSVGAGLLLSKLSSVIYAFLSGNSLVSRPELWAETTRTAISILVIGGMWWWWHWHKVSLGDVDSTIRRVVIFFLAIFTGVAVAIGSASTILFLVIRWVLGLSFSAEAMRSPAVEFAASPNALACLVIGLTLWKYHAAAIQQGVSEVPDLRPSAMRIYRYLIAGTGLATFAVGITLLLSTALRELTFAITKDSIALVNSSAPSYDFFATALTLTLVGGLVWAGYWVRQQAMVANSGNNERESLSRRILIYLAFGVSTLAGGISVISLLVMLLSQIFEGRLSSDLFVDGSWAIGTICTGLSISIYHWFILREDRNHGAPPQTSQQDSIPRKITIVANRTSGHLVARQFRRLGHDISQWEILDQIVTGKAKGRITGKQTENLINAIERTDAEAILVIINQDGYHILPYKPV